RGVGVATGEEGCAGEGGGTLPNRHFVDQEAVAEDDVEMARGDRRAEYPVHLLRADGVPVSVLDPAGFFRPAQGVVDDADPRLVDRGGERPERLERARAAG